MQGMKPLGPVPDARENTVSLMVIWSRLLAPHLAHQIQERTCFPSCHPPSLVQPEPGLHMFKLQCKTYL